MSGAIALAGMAALRAGAGLVTLGVPDLCLETVAAFEPCYMTVALPCNSLGLLAAAAEGILRELAARSTALAIGPGLGRGPDLNRLVRALYCGIPMPVVFDADGLNALAALPDGLSSAGGPRILTPHPGEFQRLSQQRAADRQQQEEEAVKLAGRYKVVVVLKGHETLITDGSGSVRNTTGNPGLASGGSGDVLTGIITALLCQGLSTWDAARLGVHLHGLAGDRAARQLTQIAMTPRDVIQFLPEAFRELG
jgi:NAD(P)H-hydrate epimerase